MKWTNKGHEYDEIAAHLIDKKTRYYIWGAGTFGIAFCEEFCEEFSFTAFVDRNIRKQGTEVCGLPVLSPSDFQKQWNGEIVIVSTGMTRSAYEQLESFGLVRHKDFYHIDEISSIYMLYKYGKVYLSDLTIPITQYCTLKCKYCNSFIPKIKNPVNFDIQQIRDELEAYFRWTDTVNILGLVGGDAMSHPRFNEILRWIGDTYYPERARHLEIYSNAVITPTPQTLELFKKYNVFYRFTDYGGSSGKQNIDQITAILRENDIRYDHVKFTDWFDSGYPQTTNGITSEDGLRRFFDMCDRKSCHTISGSKLLFCGQCMSADWIDYCRLADSDYFDLSIYDETRKREFVEYNLGFNQKGYMEYCRMCNGSLNVNTHKIIPGEQLG